MAFDSRKLSLKQGSTTKKAIGCSPEAASAESHQQQKRLVHLSPIWPMTIEHRYPPHQPPLRPYNMTTAYVIKMDAEAIERGWLADAAVSADIGLLTLHFQICRCNSKCKSKAETHDYHCSCHQTVPCGTPATTNVCFKDATPGRHLSGLPVLRQIRYCRPASTSAKARRSTVSDWPAISRACSASFNSCSQQQSLKLCQTRTANVKVALSGKVGVQASR